jgi:hypothetical protein
MLSSYLFIGSEHKGDAWPKNYKGLFSIPKSAPGSTNTKTA